MPISARKIFCKHIIQLFENLCVCSRISFSGMVCHFCLVYISMWEMIFGKTYNTCKPRYVCLTATFVSVLSHYYPGYIDSNMLIFWMDRFHIWYVLCYGAELITVHWWSCPGFLIVIKMLFQKCSLCLLRQNHAI